MTTWIVERVRLVFPSSALHYTADIILTLLFLSTAIAFLTLGVVLFTS
jgi:hypothetical protein